MHTKVFVYRWETCRPIKGHCRFGCTIRVIEGGEVLQCRFALILSTNIYGEWRYQFQYLLHATSRSTWPALRSLICQSQQILFLSKKNHASFINCFVSLRYWVKKSSKSMSVPYCLPVNLNYFMQPKIMACIICGFMKIIILLSFHCVLIKMQLCTNKKSKFCILKKKTTTKSFYTLSK